MTKETPPPVQENKASSLPLLVGFVLIGVLVLAIALVMALRSQLPEPSLTQDDSGNLRAGEGIIAVEETPVALTNFTLPASTGNDLSLNDLQGKHALVFFGYSNCPDFCPLTLGEFTQIKGNLGDLGDDLYYVFISVDGERDTPQVLAEYLARFDPSFIGLQGNDGVLEPIANEYHLSYTLNTDERDANNRYTVDHTTSTYVIDPMGNLVATISYNSDVESIVAYLEGILTTSAP